MIDVNNSRSEKQVKLYIPYILNPTHPPDIIVVYNKLFFFNASGKGIATKYNENNTKIYAMKTPIIFILGILIEAKTQYFHECKKVKINII